MLRPGVCLCSALILIACTSAPLEPPPRSFDLSGDWVIDVSRSTAPPGFRAERDRPKRGDMAARFLSQDFPVLFAEEMRIEQNRDSMGIDFGSGIYRDVTWGDRDRPPWRIRAGWSEGALQIYSETHDASSYETYMLSEGGNELLIKLEVNNSGQRQSFTRVFVRRSPL